MRVFIPVLIMNFSVMCAVTVGAEEPPQVSALAQEWLEIKTLLLKDAGSGGGAPAKTSALLDRFGAALARFFASPVGQMYPVQPVDPALRTTVFSADTRALAAALKTAVEQGERAQALTLTADMDAVITALQQMELEAADFAQLSYFRLTFFFSALIIAAILCLSAVYRKMEKAVVREQQSRSFSRETIRAQEAERSRIARELHDSVAQDLWRLSLQTGEIREAGEAERSRLCAEVVRGHQTLLERLRRICGGLVPPDFRHQGLPAALRSFCRDFEKRTGIECRLMIQDDLRMDGLDPEMQLQCFRLVQEALANVEKHSGSPEAVVVLRNDVSGKNAVLRICVSDSGKGFTPPAEDAPQSPPEDHFGIRNMYERAAIVNGRLTIDSEDGEGTTITLETALSAAAPQGA